MSHNKRNRFRKERYNGPKMSFYNDDVDDEFEDHHTESFKENERYHGAHGSSSNSGSSRQNNGKERPPKDLKGRALGLWYAKHNKRNKRASSEERRAKQEEKNRFINEKPLGSILLSASKKNNIDLLLKEASSLYPKIEGNISNSYEHLGETDFKHEFLHHIKGDIVNKMKSSSTKSVSYKNPELDKQFYEELIEKQGQIGYQEMEKIREKLPAMIMKEKILKTINEHQVIVISGETGCGKTTQVAQFILDDFINQSRGSECKIVCTQPRRISAIAVAERVADERNEKISNSVGFQIRLEKKMPRDRASILYCTTGVLLKYMESDPALSHVSHLILDEIHERDVISDFLITLLKDIILYRGDIKIILMSATLNADAFSKYYNSAPHINIPGITYPVTEYFLEDVIQQTHFSFESKKEPIWKQKSNNGRIVDDFRQDYLEPYLRQLYAEKKYDRFVVDELRKPESEKLNINLIFELLLYICAQDTNGGAILVFMTGFKEIQMLIKKIEESSNFPHSKYITIPLHSQLSTVDQKQIFNPAPKGMRKIIIATNIAETSITIDDVTIVIDCGFIKVTNLDPETGIESLQSQWVSSANALQRKGRAGRVQSGTCYHLFTKVRYNLLEKFQKPEVLRKRLENVILNLKMLQLGEAEPFLSKLMDPPELTSIVNSVLLLRRLGALDQQETLTPLGFHMAKLPIGAQCAKMLIMASLFSCLDPVLSVAAALDFKDGFQLSTSDPHVADRARLDLSNRSNSDHILMHFAIKGFEDTTNTRQFCKKYFLSAPILRLLKNMKMQFAQLLHEMNFVANSDPKSPQNNRNSSNLSLVKAIICSGLYPNVAIITRFKVGRFLKLRSTTHEKMEFHPKSLLNRVGYITSRLVVYYQRLKSAQLYVHDGTIVYPLPVVFFGDEFQRIHNTSFSGISINGTMRFSCSNSTSLIIQKLRDCLNKILEYRVSHPIHVDWIHDTLELRILGAIMEIITLEDTEEMDLSDFDDL